MPVLSAETLSLPVSVLWIQCNGYTLSVTAFRYSSTLHYTTETVTLQGLCEKKSANMWGCCENMRSAGVEERGNGRFLKKAPQKLFICVAVEEADMMGRGIFLNIPAREAEIC